ncbi:COP1-interactive protein 1 isoform X1 [Schistocerca americana]|uniref:COP1-interactive protein 1 isoform X1 n=1 Tax=Schistocerca americana TaxID=7009 RepID=UPI001F4F5B3E|nr:COP1-interactive protein 1 isoform X1 [Schistocerca americana]
MYSRQFPASKGDPLCPLGFHPQVRWPTRCKRCFRDYKEHGGRGREQSDSLRRDEATSSSPSLSSWATSSSPSRSRDDSRSSTDSGLGSSSSSRSSWLSSSSQSEDSSSSSSSGSSSRFGTSRPASSWTSTPDLGNLKDDTTADIATSFSFTLPRRKPQPQPQDTGQDRASSAASATYYFRRHTSDLSHLLDLSNHSSSPAPSEPVKQQKPTPSPSRVQQNEERENINKQRRLKIQSLKEVHSVDAPTNPEVEFIIQVKKSAKNKDASKNNAVNNKSKTTSSIPTSSSSSSGTSSEDSIEDESSDDDATSTAGTETTETTLVNDNELQDQIESLKQELEMTRSRCERLEREKSDLLLRRIASIDMAPSKTAASEVLKLQQKVNELQTQLEDVKDDKKSLSLRVKELEEELETRPDKNATQRVVDDLRSKLLAAETLCEELMDENEDMKKELRDLEEEIEELQDNFREDQADEYTSLKKELEQTAKNCRILSFKLRKAERRAEQMEAEKLEAERKCRELAGGQAGLDKSEQIKHMEQELAVANEVAIRLQKELDEAVQKLKAQEEVKEDKKPTKKPPMLGSIGKTSSGEKLSRESLTRGGSQDDPAQLLRDLQDAMEREADLREQLRFAEEELQRRGWSKMILRDITEALPSDVHSELLSKLSGLSHHETPVPKEVLHSSFGLQSSEDPLQISSLARPVVIQSAFKSHTAMHSLSKSVEKSDMGTQTLNVSNCTTRSVQVSLPEIEYQVSSTQTFHFETVNEETQTSAQRNFEVETQTDTESVNQCTQTDFIHSVETRETQCYAVHSISDIKEVQTDFTAYIDAPLNVQAISENEMRFLDSVENIYTGSFVENKSDSDEYLDAAETLTESRTPMNDSAGENIKDTTSVGVQVIHGEFVDETSRAPALHQNVIAMRQMQFSLSTMYPHGALLSSCSPMSVLMAPLGHRNSPGPARLTPEPPIEKDEGISDEEDPAELRLLLELNEQEAAVLRRKVEELEKEGETLKKKVKDLQDKLTAKTTRKSAAAITTPEPAKGSDVLYEQKIKVLEDELSELRKKLIEKERDCERLHAELTVTQKRFSKGTIQKSKSLDSSTDQQTLDLKRQLQVIEQEAAILRTRTQALETENEKLTAENKKLQLVRGTKKTMNSTATDETSDRAVELKERIADLERQLEEANKKVKELQTKIDEQENEKKTAEPKKKTVSPEVSKLRKEVKAKTEELEKLKTNFTKTESENEKLNQELKRLKDEALQDVLRYYKQRSPKKPTDLTTKVQMKKMVEDLENEIGDILVILNKSETENLRLKGGLKASAVVEDDKLLKEAKDKLEKDLEKATGRVEELERELREEKDKAEKDRKKAVKDKKVLEEGKKKSDEEKQKLEAEKKLWESDKKKHEETVRKLEDEKRRATEEAEKLFKEKQILEDQVITLNAEKAAATVKQDEITLFVKRIEALKTELEEEKKQGVEQRKKLESLQKMEQEKNRLQKEVTENSTKMAELEKKAKETEEKLKRTERILSTNKNKVSKLEKELEEEKERARAAEVTQQGVAASWLAERDGLKQQIATLQSQIDSLEATLGGKTVLIEQLEKTLKEERESVSDATEKARSAERNEISSLQDKLSSSKGEIEELTKKLEKAENNLKANEEKNKKLEAELKTQRSELETKVSGIEANLQAEKKKCERLKANQEKELKNREQELTSLRTKLKTLESNSGASTKKLTEVKQEYQEKIDKLEEELANEKQEYEDLTTKYEMLEEEHVVTKAQLVMEKETLQGQLLSLKRELASAESELRTLRETYNSKQDAWIKEKLDQQEKLKELEAKTARNADEAWAQEKARLKTIVEEKNKEIESVKKEKRVFSDQADHFRKENEELRRKLDDFEKVAKVQRNISGETTVMEKEIREMKNKLYQEEKSHKAEVAQLKLRYDNQMALIGEEIQSLQAQVTRFKRERDNYRHMLDAAQKTIADLKAMPQKSRKDSKSADGDVDEDEEMRNKIASLEQQVSCMEDELSEARLESSKLKTELVSERSSWEIKLAEMQSRVNELEEDRILSTGRTKIAGMRTRMELAWQKEREEQHRLLQETSTLARDLRQTLFEVERERDKERLEAKRRLDQLKKSTEEEQEENKKKVSELQCDLLELRDAHAKLRTTNEKLRREKERYEKEREEMRQVISARKRADQDEERKVNMIIQQVDELMRLAPDLFSGKEKAATTAASTAQSPSTPTPPRRLKGPKSRESSPSLERKEFVKESSVDRKIQLQTTMQKLTEVTEELRKQQKLTEEERDRDRARRAMGMRRAASTESDNPPEVRMRPKTGNSKGIQQKGSLYRKSLSLEQTSAQEQQSIWTDTENEGSLSSLQSVGSDTFYPLKRRETSMDSRLSGGSTQSETPHSTEKKKKKSLLGKLKKLTKSRSTEETNTASDYPMSASAQGSDFGGSGSDISTGGQEDRGSKKDMRDRLTGMFKKSGSRSNSLERSTRGIKDQSPALSDRSESVPKKSGTLPRPSPARSDVGPTSSMARPLSPGVKRPTTPTIPSNTTKLHRPK